MECVLSSCAASSTTSAPSEGQCQCDIRLKAPRPDIIAGTTDCMPQALQADWNGLLQHVCLSQVMFDATMLLAQEYRAMLARAKQRSAEKLTEQLRKVRTLFSLFPQDPEKALPWVSS